MLGDPAYVMDFGWYDPGTQRKLMSTRFPRCSISLRDCAQLDHAPNDVVLSLEGLGHDAFCGE
jgi:hypothetical protein